jgi:hypothetical protein
MLLSFALLLAAQDVKIDDFEADPLVGWTRLKIENGVPAEDPDATAGVVRDAAQVKSGKGSLAYAHDVTPGVLRILALQRELELKGAKSVRFWIKSSAATAVVLSLTERNGASWQCPFTLAAGAWQEVAVNLDEFTIDDPSKDDNGRLDIDQVASLHLFDFGGMLATLVPDLQGRRTLWIDDLAFSPKAVAATTGTMAVTVVVPVLLLDSFETTLVRWAPLSVEFSDTLKINLFDIPLAVDATAPAGGGKQSLKATYPRRAAKANAVMRSTEKLALGKATSLELWLKTSADGTYLVNLEEKDGSRYDKTVALKAADGWTSLRLPLGEFALAQDSQDENGRLDAAEIKQVLVADATTLLGGPEAAEVRLWLDEVRFVLAP